MAGELPNGYTGQTFPIPLGTQGVISDLAPGQIPPTALIDANNVDFGPGYIQKSYGWLQIEGPLGDAIVAFLDYWPTPQLQRMLMLTSGGTVTRRPYSNTIARDFLIGANVVTGLGTLLTNKSMFVVGGNETAGNPKKVFLFTDGKNQIKVLTGDGTAFTDIASPATDWALHGFPKVGIIHRNRLWVFRGSQFYTSTTSDHENFTDGTQLLTGLVGPGDGGDITGVMLYKGRILVFKEGDVIYYLNDEDIDSDTWYFIRYGDGLGINTPQAGVQALDDLLVANTTGSVTSLQATQQFGGIKQGDIFRAGKVSQFFRDNLHISGFRGTQGIYYAERQQVFFIAKTHAGGPNDALICLDIQNPDSPRYSMQTTGRDGDYTWSPSCIALWKDVNDVKRPVLCTSGGIVYLASWPMHSRGGTLGSYPIQQITSGYQSTFQTPHLDFRQMDSSLTNKNKNYDFIGVTFQETGNWNLNIDIFIDGAFSKTYTCSMAVRTDYLDAFVLDASRTASLDEKTIWVPIAGSGKTISLRCWHGTDGYAPTEVGQNFKVSHLTVGFTVAGEDATRGI